MTSEGRLTSFASSAASSKDGPRSKENGPDMSLDWTISASRLLWCARRAATAGSSSPTSSRHPRLRITATPVNALGYLRVMFAVDDIDEMLERLQERGAQLVGEVVQYKSAYRLCYIRGPEGLLIGLAQELS
jgi:hypothetical protein